MNIYVGNLSWSMTDDDLSNLFSQYGTVSSAKILKEKNTGRSKGFGFVEMEDEDAAKTAIATLNESEVQGRKLIVNESQPRPEGSGYKKSGGGGYGGSRGGGGGYGGAIGRAEFLEPMRNSCACRPPSPTLPARERVPVSRSGQPIAPASMRHRPFDGGGRDGAPPARDVL